VKKEEQSKTIDEANHWNIAILKKIIFLHKIFIYLY
jgi:hypothetical protein